MTARRALVTGACGQDGTYLTRELADQGYEVVATARRPAVEGAPGEWVTLDLADSRAIRDVVRQTRPDFVFNLAALSSGRGMFDDPIGIAEVNGMAVTRLLEAIRQHCPNARVCQASSSEIFGLAESSPQSESSPVAPRSPYGAAKLYADNMVRVYRQSFGLFACSAILFNHESPMRRPEFVSRKITLAAAKIKMGLQQELLLGDLDARRDWAFAGDFARAMRLMLEQSQARDYVLATGETHSVRNLCEIAFGHLGLDYRNHVKTDSAAVRPAESTQLVGDASRARTELGWHPRVGFEALVRMMVDADMARLRTGAPSL